MSAMASQITGVSIVYSAVCLGEDQRKYQRSASLAFVERTQRLLEVSLHKKASNAENVSIDDVIMKSVSQWNSH